MANITETGNWVDNVNLVMPYEVILGGEYGTDNRAPTQLANRASWLRNILLVEHSATGEHSVGNVGVAADAAIEESKLALNNGITTSKINDSITDLNDRVDAIDALINMSLGKNGSAISAAFNALLFTWRYGDARIAFDLFTEDFSFAPIMEPIRTVCSVAGDDSIDIVPYDASNPITINRLPLDTDLIFSGTDANTGLPFTRIARCKIILGNTRVLYVNNCDVTCNDGVLSAGNYTVTSTGADFLPGQAYITQELSILKGQQEGIISIGQTSPDICFTVTYEVNGSTYTATPIGTPELMSPGIYSVKYAVSGGNIKFILQNTSSDTVHVDHIAVYRPIKDVQVSYVRTPQVPLSSTTGFFAGRYAGLYDTTFAGAELELKKGTNGAIIALTGFPHTGTVEETRINDIIWEFDLSQYTLPVWATNLPTDTDCIIWRVRYKNNENSWSYWSDESEYRGVL